MALILVIDDEDQVRTMVRHTLEKMGHTVCEAANGNDGLHMFECARFDLVVTDIIMPEMEGIETIMEIRRRNPEARIIAMSGGGRARNLEFLPLAKKLGADQALRKPFRRAELLEVVDLALTGRIL